jgi:signal transduction histidine kinase
MPLDQNLYQIETHDNQIQIEFAAISYLTPNLEFRYKINKKWYSTRNRQIVLRNLLPGNYTVEIEVFLPSTLPSERPKAYVNLEITPRFWQTMWFNALIIVLCLLFIYWLWQLRYKHLYKKQLVKGKIADLELRTLRAQMNPHFLFNVLNTIQNSFLQHDIRTANRLLSKFSKLVRGLLENSLQNHVSLADEVELLENYILLENSRFSFESTVFISPEINSKNIYIPSMLIQPLVENAILHGLAPKKEKRKLTIEFRKENKSIRIIIEDNGVGRNY